MSLKTIFIRIFKRKEKEVNKEMTTEPQIMRLSITKTCYDTLTEFRQREDVEDCYKDSWSSLILGLIEAVKEGADSPKIEKIQEAKTPNDERINTQCGVTPSPDGNEEVIQ